MLITIRRAVSHERMRHGFRGLTSFAEALAATPSKISILYGSHSGNTERLAKQLDAEVKWRLGKSTLLGSTSLYSFDDLSKLDSSSLVLLLTSTYGDGGPNANTQLFWDTVFSHRNPSLGFSFSVLSRGSSLYGKNFARAGRELDARLAELGAHRAAPLGIQDKIGLDQDEEFFNWKEQVIQHLIDMRGYEERPFNYEPTLQVKEVAAHDTESDIFYQDAGSSGLKPTAMAAHATQLASTSRQYVFAEAQLPSDVHYKTGDYLLIWPENPEREVAIFLDAVFGSSPRRDHALMVDDGERVVRTSYRLLTSHSLDINGRVERDLLLKLANFAPNDEVRQRALALVGDKKKLLSVTAQQGNHNLARLLRWLSPDEPWIKNFPASAFLDILPHLLPRRYSISSSSIEQPHAATLSAVVERDAESGFEGVTTGQLSALIDKPSQTIMGAVEPLTSFRPPSNPSVPLLMFAIGTGVAPFRAFVRERALVGSDAGPTVLFAGSRTAEDLIHREEFLEFEADANFDFQLVPAYSRVEETHPDKGYIFEKLASHQDLIWDLLQKGAEVYICGDIRKIRRGIRDGIAAILSEKMGLPPKLGQREFKKLKRAGRIHLDLW